MLLSNIYLGGTFTILMPREINTKYIYMKKKDYNNKCGGNGWGKQFNLLDYISLVTEYNVLHCSYFHPTNFSFFFGLVYFFCKILSHICLYVPRIQAVLVGCRMNKFRLASTYNVYSE